MHLSREYDTMSTVLAFMTIYFILYLCHLLYWRHDVIFRPEINLGYIHLNLLNHDECIVTQACSQQIIDSLPANVFNNIELLYFPSYELFIIWTLASVSFLWSKVAEPLVIVPRAAHCKLIDEPQARLPTIWQDVIQFSKMCYIYVLTALLLNYAGVFAARGP